MSKADVIRKLKDLMVEVWSLDINAEKISEDSNYLAEFGINSVDVLEFLVRVEKVFNIEIDDDDLNAELVESIPNMAEYIIKRQNASTANL